MDATATGISRGQDQRLAGRRTTPVYQHCDQAYASMTGSANVFRFPSSTVGADSLNNIYTRAMRDEPCRQETHRSCQLQEELAHRIIVQSSFSFNARSQLTAKIT